MKKYAVGDVVMIPVKVTAVHPQGFASGLDKFGRPLDPTETETADVVIAEIDSAVEVDAHGCAHFSAGSEF